MIMIIGISIGFIIGAVLIYFILRPRLKATKLIDIETQHKNDLIQQQYKENKQNLEYSIKQLEKINLDITKLDTKRTEIQNSINELQAQAKNSADIFYQNNMEIAKQKLNNSLKEEEDYFNSAKEAYQKEYLLSLEEYSKQMCEETENREKLIQQLTEQIIDYKEKVNAIVEANKRAEEQLIQKDFYKIILSKDDIIEIEELKKVSKLLRNDEPLNKVIWKCYYEKPTSDLISRVVGKDIRTGIYKITNIENGKCYVGQAVDLASRWKQHIKRGLGAETATKNKLYPAMKECGVENFTFEIIEDCSKEKLDEREKYWQEFYEARSFGYSIR